MKQFISKIAITFFALIAITSCYDDRLNILDGLEIGSEDVNSAIEILSIVYPITAFQDDNTETVIANDTELETYNQNTTRPKFKFPINVIVDGETKTTNSTEELKELIVQKRQVFQPEPFEFIFPLTIVVSGENVEIKDKESFKKYRERIRNNERLKFVFPLSVKIDGEIKVINNKEEFDDLRNDKVNDDKPDTVNPNGVKFVFPLTVITNRGDKELTNQEEFNAFVATLPMGTPPRFKLPISVIIDDETKVITTEEELRKTLGDSMGNGENPNDRR